MLKSSTATATKIPVLGHDFDDQSMTCRRCHQGYWQRPFICVEERYWLSGKPVGGARQNPPPAKAAVDVDVTRCSRGARRPLRRKVDSRGVGVRERLIEAAKEESKRTGKSWAEISYRLREERKHDRT